MYMIAAIQLVSPNNLAAAETAAASRMPEESFKVSLIEPDYSLAVTATKLLSQTKGREVVLVDIRSPEEFERLRIPGSINVALHALKTKAFLKAQPFVLVNAGFQWGNLEDECRRLRKIGFKPSILVGGLVAWRNQDGPLEGDQLLFASYRLVPAHLLFDEKDYGNLQAVEVADKSSPDAIKLIPGAMHVKNIESLKKFVEKKDPNYCILVLFNEHGDSYEKFYVALKKAGISSAFFLDGGLSGYRKFMENTALSWKSKEERIITFGACNSCGSGNPEKQNIDPTTH